MGVHGCWCMEHLRIQCKQNTALTWMYTKGLCTQGKDTCLTCRVIFYQHRDAQMLRASPCWHPTDFYWVTRLHGHSRCVPIYLARRLIRTQRLCLNRDKWDATPVHPTSVKDGSMWMDPYSKYTAHVPRNKADIDTAVPECVHHNWSSVLLHVCPK